MPIQRKNFSRRDFQQDDDLRQILSHRKLTKRRKQEMLAILLRNDAAFGQVSALLTARHIEENWHHGYACLYRMVRTQYKKTGVLPPRTWIETTFEAELEDDPHGLTEKEKRDVTILLASAFDEKYYRNQNTGQLARLAIDTAKDFLLQCEKRNLKKKTSEEHELDLSPLLTESMERAQRIEALGSGVSTTVFPEDWDIEAEMPMRPTGCSALDFFLGGGDTEGDVNLFMGPYGSCKSLLAVQCTCASIESAIAATVSGQLQGRRPICVLASYEAPIAEFRNRCLAFMARVPFTKLNTIRSLSELAQPGAPLQKYERRLFKHEISTGQTVLSEIERVRQAMRKVNEYVWFLDLSSGNGVGGGAVPELAGIIKQRLQSEPDLQIWSFWVDHLDAMVDEHMLTAGIKPDDRRHLLKAIPNQLRRQLAIPCKTRIWLLHQLSGETNAKSPTAFIHHTNGAECKAVAAYASFSIVVGNQDSNQRCVWRCTKRRRRKADGSELVMQIDGEFGRVINVSNEWTVDHDARAIVARPREEARRSSEPAPERRVIRPRRLQAPSAPASEDNGLAGQLGIN